MAQREALADQSSQRPDYGRRLLPVLIDEIARNDPDRPWASVPVDDWDLALGYEDISFARLANGINKLAHFIIDHVGPSPAGTFETILYLGVPDLRYSLMQMAACKTGYQVLLPSLLNTRDIHLSLIRQAQCKIILSAVGVHTRDLISGKEAELRHFQIPELDDLLDGEVRAEPFPYTKTYEEAAHDPFIILHSSGTTGDPKLVRVNHAAFASLDRQALLPDEGASAGGRGFLKAWAFPGKGARVLMVSPPFHGSSAYTALPGAVFGEGVFVPGYRHRAVGTQDICGILEHAKCTIALLTPWMMEDVARRPDGAYFISKLEWTGFGGAVLSPLASKEWSKHTRIQNVWASTEAAFIPQVKLVDPEEYEFCLFDTEKTGVRFRDSGAITLDKDGIPRPLMEMVLVLTSESAPYAFWAHREGLLTHDSKPLNSTGPPVEVEVGDLWMPHPDPAKASFAWSFAGRTDDLITFSTGSNFYPIPVQKALDAHPKVNQTLVFGMGRLQPVAVIELAKDVAGDQQTQQELWEIVEEQNERVPTFGRVQRNHMLLVEHGGFVRTASKGTAMRKEIEKKYAAQIDKIYEEFGDQWQGSKDRYGSVIVETTFSFSTSTHSDGD